MFSLILLVFLILPALSLHMLILYSAIVRRRNPYAWGLLALLIGPFALLVAVLPTRETQETEPHPFWRTVLNESICVVVAGGLLTFVFGLARQTSSPGPYYKTRLESTAPAEIPQQRMPVREALKAPLRLEQPTPTTEAESPEFVVRQYYVDLNRGLDHGVGHFRPLSITRQRHLLAYHGIAMSYEGLCQVF